MKKLLILLFIGFNAFSQTFEVVNKGYYYGVVGETTLPNRTTDLKSLTDVQEYLDKNNLEHGEVVRPPLEVKRKKTISQPPTIIRDTVYINNGDISIGNQWMGEPIREVKATGNIISDTGGSHISAGGLDAVFDGNIDTYRRANNQKGAWIGLDFGIEKNVTKIRMYTKSQNLNGNQIQYHDGNIWVTLHTISNVQVNEWYEVKLEGVTSQRIRVYSEPSYSYGGHIAELEIYPN